MKKYVSFIHIVKSFQSDISFTNIKRSSQSLFQRIFEIIITYIAHISLACPLKVEEIFNARINMRNICIRMEFLSRNSQQNIAFKLQYVSREFNQKHV